MCHSWESLLLIINIIPTTLGPQLYTKHNMYTVQYMPIPAIREIFLLINVS